MKYYLAGPMTGRPQYNYPLFDRVAGALREKGLDIVSPAEMDDDAVRAEAMASTDGIMPETNKVSGETWGDFLARDVKLIADELDAIILLPEWETSRGARLEAFVSLSVNNPVSLWREGNDLLEVSASYVIDEIRWAMSVQEAKNESVL